MGVRERKQRQKGKGLSAIRAATTTDLNPVVILIVSLLAAASVADNRTTFTNGALRQNDLVAVSGPVSFELVRRGRKWDKENRNSQGSCPGIGPPRSQPEAGPLLLLKRIQLEENTASHLQLLGM
jgi:hypothetical protein